MQIIFWQVCSDISNTIDVLLYITIGSNTIAITFEQTNNIIIVLKIGG